ncbi:MAG: 50S ribosomal protein L3 [Methanosarcina thermophila]|jgi:large subunit ribosomal protein L3|uniref:Large ribosomal subunit protein uL3 n=2 Tax=Methanosarcina thermophila TaxID=2210 RepID=A0A1I6XQE0_METTE|nr:50S ribosomal protein L3 [Methanosarcina thermophila]ALK05633.1 MAG: 50S ribosomal protein L3 [Methanosarcina sp. 795]AKB16456.1 LSU ribosomal protein L3e (L3p) [Methanosarcina thermophila CHTI-55]NLU56952.1 50S ribosomal protein L3 [Methanosarcina thermophila]SFT40101.1 LSU ribosomal protein L3P [Methanosarcina thermophila]BAW30670.1 50S ribosomal protein L3P [Methanosarcina thermophila]
MASIHRPKRGSLAFSPRKRAKSHIPRFRAWPEATGEPRLQSFAGYKVGMTHVIMIDDTKNSLTQGMEISVPVTVIETPAIRVAAIRAYAEDSTGEKAVAEAWAADLDPELKRRIPVPAAGNVAENLEKIEKMIEEGKISDIRAITYTLPKNITGVPKKKPDIMESGISARDLKTKFEYAKSILGTLVSVTDVFKAGTLVDTAAITTGKGTQGPVKRWGIQLMKSKHSRQGSLRQVGTLGPWHPARVSWRVPQMGQMGYHQRTEFNKRILKIGSDGEEVTPEGGFINYGIVRGDYVLIKGSVPGPSKRLIRLRDPIRAKKADLGEPNILHISRESKQG